MERPNIRGLQGTLANATVRPMPPLGWSSPQRESGANPPVEDCKRAACASRSLRVSAALHR